MSGLRAAVEAVRQKRNEWRKEYDQSRTDADYGRWDGWHNALLLLEALAAAPEPDEAALTEVLRRTWLHRPGRGRYLASAELEPDWFPAFAAAIVTALRETTP